jgi:hypothetical protein
MNKRQQALVVKEIYEKGSWTSNLQELNTLLEAGWRVKKVRPMGACGYGTIGSDHYGFASLVVIEKEK